MRFGGLPGLSLTACRKSPSEAGQRRRRASRSTHRLSVGFRLRPILRPVVAPGPLFLNRFSGLPEPVKEKKFHEIEKNFAFRGK